MAAADKNMAFWELYETDGFMDVQRYLKVVADFVATGEVPDVENVGKSVYAPWATFDDPLLGYLKRLMSDPVVQVKVLSGKAAARLFYVTVGRFVVNCLHNTQFESKRTWTEYRHSCEVADFSPDKERRHWESIVAEVGERHGDDGFDKQFFTQLFSTSGGADRQENWEKLRHDWQEAIFNHLCLKESEWIDRQGRQVPMQLDTAYKQMKQVMQSMNADDDDAAAAYDMMDGTWSESEFERQLQVIKLRDRYPILDEIIKKMGWKADEAGTERLSSAEGMEVMLHHSGGSDIDGITIGNDVNSLLPSEWAQCADETLERLFVYKYITKHLQVFRCKSNVSKPTRRLSSTSASRLGPVIVCADTSASMKGLPERVEKVLLEQLTAMVQNAQRDCFFIDFSVAAYPVDLKARRYNRLLNALGTTEKDMPRKEPVIPFLNGGTNARNMMDMMFSLLDGQQYANADVLWITDFDIPMAAALAGKMAGYRRTGTRFYGLRITDGDQESKNTPWESYFDKVYTLKYRRVRRF